MTESVEPWGTLTPAYPSAALAKLLVPAITSVTVAFETTDSGDAADDEAVLRHRLETTAETLLVN